MHTEHSFKKSYFSHFKRCMHCNKRSVLKMVYKCNVCSKVTHKSCLEINQGNIERLRLETTRLMAKDQNTPVKMIRLNEFGERLEQNYLYNKFIIEKQHPISVMSENYLKARHAEHKSLFFIMQRRLLKTETCATESVSRIFGQEPSPADTEPEQRANVFRFVEEIVSEAQELLAEGLVVENSLEEQERRSEIPEPVEVASEPDAAKPQLDEPASDTTSVTNLESRVDDQE